MRVRIPDVRIPHTSRRSSVFVKTRRGSLASLAASSNSRPASRTGRRPRGPGGSGDRWRADRRRRRPPGRARCAGGARACARAARGTRHGDDVVRAALESPNACDGVRARLGQHDHRHVPVPRPSGLTRAQPAAEVGVAGNHEIGRDAFGEIERAGRPARAEDSEPVLAQMVLEDLPRTRLVLGEEDGTRAHLRRR